MPNTATVSKTRSIRTPRFKYERYPITTMEVGESFGVRYSNRGGEIKARQDICSALFNLKRRGLVTGKKFTVRKHENREIRCWRTV